ncbi:MAG TPA: flagellar assembly protein H, partial [Cyanobacteria bacterium UBA11162]|nr:flagellar assembly protein H [Cyanobacteria bacterium UBA11162]
GREVSSEVRQIDIYFTPNPRINEYSQKLGVLGKMAATTALFEP